MRRVHQPFESLGVDVDLLLVGDPGGGPADDPHHSQGHDERLDSAERHLQPVGETGDGDHQEARDEAGRDAMAALQEVGDEHRHQRDELEHALASGTSDQRMRWFKSGLANGDMAACDTFGASEL